MAYHLKQKTMKFITAILISLCVFNYNSFAKSAIKLNCVYVDNRIILEIQSSKGKTLNFLFDTGSNDFLVDSAVAFEYNLCNSGSKKFGASFPNGQVRGKFFSSSKLFKNDSLNALYSYGVAIKISQQNIGSRIKIDGIIGVNRAIEKLVTMIDFEDNTFEILTSIPVNTSKNSFQIGLIYTDNGYGAGLSEYYKKLSATRAKFYISNEVFINTNISIDTGSNIDFVLLTSQNIDSLIKKINKPYESINKKQSLGNNLTTEYKFKADSIVVDNLILKKDITMNLTPADKMINISFGSLKTFGLIGAPFLKQYKRVFFDYPAQRLLIEK